MDNSSTEMTAKLAEDILIKTILGLSWFFERISGTVVGDFVEFFIPGQKCTSCEGGYVENQGYTYPGNQCRKCGGLGFK